jgi:chemosensory pili system protein ChpA (sensor histidine kinase/response regulator)
MNFPRNSHRSASRLNRRGPTRLNASTASAPQQDIPELVNTAILPKMDFGFSAPVQSAEAPLEIAGIDFSSLSAATGPLATGEVPMAPLDAFHIDLPETLSEAEPMEAAAPTRDDQVKVIGDLRIGIPLYNVYLNEADEWSRRLATEISEWTLEMNKAVPDSTVGWAHALAGSSATVGFQALSDIARALEAALQHTQSLAEGTPQHARTFTEAAEEVRRLLHQFAAGFLKEADPRLLQDLQDLKDAEGEPRADVPEELPISGFADLDFDPQPLAAPAAPAKPMVAQAPIAKPVTLMQASTPRKPLVHADDEEELDVVDAIDPDLFPIFEEEAAELMPSLGSALRAWAAHPQQREPRDQVLRALHTLKGSARLAGALQLGELAHRMESEVEYLGQDDVHVADIEALLQRFDTMQARFDTLRATGGFAPADAAAAEPVIALAAMHAAAPLQTITAHAGAGQTCGSRASSVTARRHPGARCRTGAGPPLSRAPRSRCGPDERHLRAPASNQAVRVRSQLLDRLVTQAGEVMITRSRLESELRQLRGSLGRPDGQPGPPAHAAEGNRAAGRIPDAITHGAGEGHGRPASTRSSSTDSRACRN